MVVRYFERFVVVGNETNEEKRSLTDMRQEAVLWCCDIAEGKQPRWLSLVGHSGAGKTLLAKCCFEFLNDLGEGYYNRYYRNDPEGKDYLSLYAYAQEGSKFVKWSKLLDSVRDGDYWRLSQAVRDWVKIIDDIGAESVGRDGSPTPFAISTLGKLCDGRVGKWSIFTSNFTRKQLAERFDARIASRLMRDGNVMIESTVRDFNLRLEAIKGVESTQDKHARPNESPKTFSEVRAIMKGEAE